MNCCYCWFCGARMIWNSDFSPEDIGIEGEGVVAFLSCPGCEATAEFTYLEKEK